MPRFNMGAIPKALETFRSLRDKQRDQALQKIEFKRMMNLPVKDEELRGVFGDFGGALQHRSGMTLPSDIDLAGQLQAVQSKARAENNPTDMRFLYNIFQQEGGPEKIREFTGATEPPPRKSDLENMVDAIIGANPGISKVDAYKQAKSFGKTEKEPKNPMDRLSKAYEDAEGIVYRRSGGSMMTGITFKNENERKKYEGEINKITRLLLAESIPEIQRAVYEDGTIDEKTGAILIQKILEKK